MITPSDCLLKYDCPVLVSKSTDRKSPKGRPLRVSPQPPINTNPLPPPPKSVSVETNQENVDFLNEILPPREWMEGNQLWVQQVSSTPCTRTDVIHLKELLDTKLEQRQARLMGICPIRRELYSQCFDELIRQVTINCAERGVLLLRVRDELQMTIAAYQTLYESSVAFGMRKALQAEKGKADMDKKIADLEMEKQDLLMQMNNKKAEYVAEKQRVEETRQVEEKKYNIEIESLKRTNQQLKTQLEAITAQK
ncbi:uncharacterized protein V6R79_021982 [Siganus canaliculatus]